MLQDKDERFLSRSLDDELAQADQDQFLQCLTGDPFDAVITDLTIPGGMGGRETIEKLLEIDPEVKAIVS
ncbi:MAG: hypothetical protein ACERK6_12830, partial [Candidatus Aminicenantaceae bacterium]